MIREGDRHEEVRQWGQMGSIHNFIQQGEKKN